MYVEALVCRNTQTIHMVRYAFLASCVIFNACLFELCSVRLNVRAEYGFILEKKLEYRNG